MHTSLCPASIPEQNPTSLNPPRYLTQPSPQKPSSTPPYRGGPPVTKSKKPKSLNYTYWWQPPAGGVDS